jgi:DNA-binding transcriptional regulator GbsR (MarR family)
MEGMEARFGGVGTGDGARPFRERLVQRIAAFRIDHPEGNLDFAEIFRDLFEKIRQSYVDEHREKIRHLRRLFPAKLGHEQATDLEPADAARVDEVMRRLKDEYGYCEACALEALAFLEARLYDEAS